MTPFSLEGRTALVTGANTGIGQAIAVALAQAGADVIASGRRDCAETVAMMGQVSDKAGRSLTLNFADPMAARDVFAAQPIDILVNNAGITRDQLFMRMSDKDWHDVLDVNLTSAMRLCRGAVRPMMKARWGRIINIGSIVGSSGNPGQANYAAAKAGLVGMTKSIAAEVASRGITVNVVAPGFIATPMTEKLNDEQKAALNVQIPMARMGTSEVLYLASPEAGYVTGATLHVNGGMSMY